MDLASRLRQLEANLGEFGPNDPAPMEIAVIFNALLEEAKSQHGDDPVVKVIEPADDGEFAGLSDKTCGALKAAVAQLGQVASGR